MELVITQESEPLPIRSLENEFKTPVGILNSRYKKVVKRNLNDHSTTSIFGIKQRIKSRQYQFTPNIETLLKVSVFVITLAVIL